MDIDRWKKFLFYKFELLEEFLALTNAQHQFIIEADFDKLDDNLDKRETIINNINLLDQQLVEMPQDTDIIYIKNKLNQILLEIHNQDKINRSLARDKSDGFIVEMNMIKNQKNIIQYGNSDSRGSTSYYIDKKK